MRRILIVVAVSFVLVAAALRAADEKAAPGNAGTPVGLKVGIATRDITPNGPIWLCGYAARNRPSDKVESPLRAGALAFEDPAGSRFVLLSLDVCEVSRSFMAPVLKAIEAKHRLTEEHVITVTSHTHSGPCLAGVLEVMSNFPEAEQKKVTAYSETLRQILVDLVGEALGDLSPAVLERGKSTAGFAMNRRRFVEGRVDFGETPSGPADRDVPVLAISSPNGVLRAILFGYACHGTTIAEGPEFYWVSGDYMGYACAYLEAAFPGAKAFYIQGCGADINPSPRGKLALIKQHGLELAGAVAGVLGRPREPVRPTIRRSFARIDLPLAPSPTREKLLADAGDKDPFIRGRAGLWLSMLDSGKGLPQGVSYPMAVVRLGDAVTFFFLAGEVVADYATSIKREFAAENPWPVAYAFETSCYIPSARILKEGGYEAQSSLIYYGIYGPLLDRTETMIIDKLRELVRNVKS